MHLDNELFKFKLNANHRDFSLNYGAKNYSLDLYRSNKMLTTKMVALANLLADSDEAYKLRQLIIDRYYFLNKYQFKSLQKNLLQN